MKNIVIAAVSFLAIATMNCGGREDVLGEYNSEPKLTLYSTTASGNEINDSLKMSGVSGLFFYQVGLRVEDINGNIESVGIDSTSNKPRLIVQSDSILINYEVVNVGAFGDSLVLELALFDVGTQDIEFTVIDQFTKKGTATLSLLVFNNKAPVAKANITIDEADGNLVHISLSDSYDLDAKYGGEIFSYSYIINGVEHLNIGSDTWSQSFPGEGEYPIITWVTDNNQVKSEVLNLSVNVK